MCNHCGGGKKADTWSRRNRLKDRLLHPCEMLDHREKVIFSFVKVSRRKARTLVISYSLGHYLRCDDNQSKYVWGHTRVWLWIGSAFDSRMPFSRLIIFIRIKYDNYESLSLWTAIHKLERESLNLKFTRRSK